jgi:hypothetical protein
VSVDYPTTNRSDNEVKEIAKRFRCSFAVVHEGRVDVVASLQRTTIPTLHGLKKLILEVCEDSELPSSEGVTTFSSGTVAIKLRRSVFQRLKMGEGRARNTAMHELGHAVMHEGPPMHRRTIDQPKLQWIPTYKSAEHQAKIFAPAALIDDEIAEALISPEDISVTFGVSYESAAICFRQIQEARERPQIVEKIKRIAAQLNLDSANERPTLSFLKTRCPNCGERTIFPVGIKYMCQTCDRLFDGFQDGDILDE